MKNTKYLLPLFAVIVSLCSATSVQAASIADRLRGYIVLQVQAHGEAWYILPSNGRRVYVGTGNAAFAAMRTYGLGITNANLAKLLNGNRTLLNQLRGRILLQVQAHGEAYFVCPRTLRVTYIKNGTAAQSILRNCGLGITNADLGTIAVESVPTPNPPSTPAPTPTPSPTPPPTPIPVPTPSPTPTPTPQLGPTTIAGCQIFPADNPWNQDVSRLPVLANSATYITSISATRTLHPDFGQDPSYGIPFNIVEASQPKVPITFDAYGDESDPGPYPIPSNPNIEAGGDTHILVLQKGSCMLYELYNARPNGNGWIANAGAVFNLNSNALRPEGWTSTDAAGLPVLPGLVRIDEVLSGKITHAIRFTAQHTQNGYIHPATHQAGQNNPALPPMGLRVRLKADYDISKLTGQAKIIAQAMKTYGMMLADNGSSWYFQGASDPRWNDSELNELKTIPGSAFEAVDTGPIIK